MFFSLSIIILAVVGVYLYNWLNRLYRKRFIAGFSSKYVFITGCDSGFGYKLAVDLDSRGLSIYAGCLTQNGADDLKKKTSTRLKTITLDVTNQSSVDEAVQFIEADLPSGKYLWGLVNNAGILGNICFEIATVEDYQRIMDVNCFGVIRVTEAVAPLIKKSGGRIVNVVSICGRGSFTFIPYSCSKFAVQPYTDGLRRCLRPFGVKVATIEPGLCGDTNIACEKVWSSVISKRWEQLPECKRQELGQDFDKKQIKLSSALINTWPLHGKNHMGMVTDVLTHALGSRHPKTRYAVGNDARLFITVSWFTPDWLLDAILRFAAYRAKCVAH